MNTDTISDFLADQRDEAPEELQPLIIQFEDLWERKLWHQLTDALVDFFDNPGSAKQRLQFYKVFILKFADKINQLKLVDLGLKAATQCRGEPPTARDTTNMSSPGFSVPTEDLSDAR
jgi:26S proteasome regulatory subunit N9